MQPQELWFPGSHAADTELKFTKTTLDVAHQGLSLWREADRAAFPLEQDGPKIPLKPTNGMADSARRQTQVLGG